MYAFGEAAHLVRVSPGTIRNWVLGYEGKDRSIHPVFETPEVQSPMVSFLQLIEVAVVGRFRKSHRYSLEKVRRAYGNAQQLFGLDYPFAHMKLEPLGGHIVGWMRGEEPDSSLQALDQPQQWTLPGVVLEVIRQFDYDPVQHLAERWYPVGKDVPIVIDPRLSSGVPTLKGHGVTIENIYKRFKARQRINFIAQDLSVEADLVETVLQYAEQVAA